MDCVRMTRDQLQNALEELGIITGGNKNDLRNRLRHYLNQQEENRSYQGLTQENLSNPIKALQTAIYKQNLAMVKDLLPHIPPEQLNQLNHKYGGVLKTPLGYATSQTASHIICSIVKSLLEAGSNPNVMDSLGLSPLYYATRRGSPNLIRLLLKNNADPNINNNPYDTPLRMALGLMDPSLIRDMIEAGGDIHQPGILRIAVESNNPSIINVILEAGPTYEEIAGAADFSESQEVTDMLAPYLQPKSRLL
jgi:Ankyrin repeats (3 copies)